MNANLPPLNSLRAFESAARHLSFTEAALELHITQSAVSHHVKALQTWLGFDLFERRGGRLRLTVRGRTYAQGLGLGLSRIVQATQEVVATGDYQILNVRGYTTFFVRWMIPRLSKFQRLHPDIKLRLTTDVEAVDFTRDVADVAIVYGDGPWEGCRSDLLFGDALTPVVSPGIAKKLKKRCSADDLLRLPLLHSRRPNQWEDWCAAVGVRRPPAEGDSHFEDVSIVYQCALEGLGVALGHLKYVQRDLDDGRLVAPHPFVLRRTRGYHLVSPHALAEEDKVARFRHWLMGQTALA